MDKHITLLATLKIGFGFLGILCAAIVFVAVVGGGIISQDHEAMRITMIVGTSVGGFLALVSIPGIIGGFGLLKRRPWARVFVLILACVDLIIIPIGTAIGIYALWVLLNEETGKIFLKEN